MTKLYFSLAPYMYRSIIHGETIFFLVKNYYFRKLEIKIEEIFKKNHETTTTTTTTESSNHHHSVYVFHLKKI